MSYLRLSRLLRFLLLTSLVVTLALACGDSTGTDVGPDASDGGGDGGDGGDGDVGPRPTCDESTVPLLEEGDAMGHAEPLGAAAGEARAGRAEASDLPVDPEGLATWKAGDLILANDRIAIVIEQAGSSQLYDPWGGKLVGAFAVEGGALVRPADFNEFIIGVGRYTLSPDSVTVLADGSDGGPAIVRALGPLRAVPFIDELGSALAPADYDDFVVAIDYILAPDANTVEQRFTFRSLRPFSTPIRLPLVLAFQFSRMPAFTPVDGFDFDQSQPTEWIGFVEEGATSYAYRADTPLTVLLEQAGTVLLAPESYAVEACSLTEQPMGRFDIGGPGVDGLRVGMSQTDGETQRAITGTVRENDGSVAVGVRVHAELADGTYYTRTLTGADGTFTLHVPETDVSLYAFRRGQEVVGPVAVDAETDSGDLTMGPVGVVDITARDMVSSDALPTRIQVISTPEIPRPPNAFGEAEIVRGRTHVTSPADGRATLLLGAGDHRVVVSRGYEYEAVTEDITISEGETVTVVADLERVIDTTDVMCGDFHVHTSRSPDSTDSATAKILSAAGDGLEIPVRTDHEFVNPFEAVIGDLGLEDHVYGVTGLELTTFTWGHFNVFPLEVLESERNGGSFDWANKLPPEVFSEVRGRAGSPSLIINHPRGFAAGAYFSAARYDATTGMVGNPEMWDEEFTLVEVFNDSDFDRNWDPSGEEDSTVMDWFSLLNAGRRVYAVGSSDSHKIYSSPVGYPRTCITVGTDSPATLRTMGPLGVRDPMNAGQSVVSGGIYVDALARGGAGPGGDVTAAMDRETVSVRVQAANWVDADRLRVFVDGALTETIVLDETTRDSMVPTTRFSNDIEVPIAAGGSWVVFVADGEDNLDPVHPGRRPFGVTNPIFFTR